MSDKKYQVFISSTYADLKEERQILTRAILDMGHIPAGMEMFPASDVEQLGYIKQVIDECDYYVLILGARYGSLDPDGVSFTEREFEYAVATKKTVLVFVHGKMDEIPRGKTDKDEVKYRKLLDFKEKAMTDRLVKIWDTPEKLGSEAILALTKAFKSHPQVGWVRANQIPSHSTVADVLRYREEIDRLKNEIDILMVNNSPSFSDVAGLNHELILHYSNFSRGADYSQAMTYFDFLQLIAPKLHTPGTMTSVRIGVETGLKERFNVSGEPRLNRSEIQDAVLHLVATGHVSMKDGGSAGGTVYQLTDLGVQTWLEMSYTKK
ncbi:DUF4062 domain-containing protein [Novosphingobium mangrovi (ex Hu et al. 2023)]|uniref:DUF4062 domain-containing protein n=1 Tax=Novosphingobium mangrovi (ex Hu et al. 2023) TaxID=2930094 RepID=A0ABT0AAF8_9SPHN|nr:DUF4062 domain-containing protein [Novosphingobium mangrovi (ex Hu et al. 2023)]MCJ1960188.1 DUF4062 domain-containing protein [Novosphingobium mangrovi (ex Hu et al. 2023)]